ncbi:MAG TPA: HAMP domain-containing sensor histidine kinase [Streptosporangiaceae bacterium]|jgi:two-component system OmpR family sensor kinase|nr:HAMP domain-containing sensor histidine kinase [Streptosporangiaceae bacterium]
MKMSLRPPSLTAIRTQLTRARRAKLRTRVLLGVLGVTLVALVAFDVAAVTALRGYLVNQTDNQLRAVLAEYRVTSFPNWQRSLHTQKPGEVKATNPSVTPPPGRFAGVTPRKIIDGPVAFLPGALGRFFVATVSGQKPAVMVGGNGSLIPRLPQARRPMLTALAEHQQAVTVPSADGQDQVRLMATRFPGVGVAYATTSMDNINRTVDQLELILVIGSAAAGLTAAGGAAWVMRRGLRPVEVMAGQADKINAGDLTDRVGAQDPRTEVGRLGEALNGMLTRIGDFVAEREASQEATRRFFADASHELRTPLASLRANAELYQQGALPERGQVDEAMRRITLEAQRMGGLVDDMLRLARLDQHPGQQREPVSVSDLAAECAQRARTAHPGRAWHCDITDGLEVTGDEELLRRAVDNVLANVASHTPEGAAATITAAERDGEVVVGVSDDGPGVPPDQLPRIFDRFFRGGAPSRRSGSGLGLAIVAAIAAAHDGHAQATLNEPHGLRVTLTLPARKPPPASPALPDAVDVICAPGIRPAGPPARARLGYLMPFSFRAR